MYFRRLNYDIHPIPSPADIERVGEWEQEIAISEEIVTYADSADPKVVECGDGLITFHVRDGSATYGLGRLDMLTLTYPARLLSVEPLQVGEESDAVLR